MTCFWDGLMKGLEKKDFEKLHFKKTNRIGLINLFLLNAFTSFLETELMSLLI